MLPPGVLVGFEANTPWMQARLISYEQVRQMETLEEKATLARRM